MTKRVTTKDIAELVGVSRTTVSFVLNNVPGMRISEETRQRVLEAVRKLDYHPDTAARSMVSRRSQVIGLVVRQSDEQVFVDHFLPQVLHGMAQAAVAEGYRTLFEPIPPDSGNDVYRRLISERHVDGIVLSGPRFQDQDLFGAYQEGMHIVTMGRLPNTGISYVDVDNVGGAATATQHLVNLGHQRIALITNSPREYTSSADRLAGYQQALEQSGIGYDESLVRYGDFTPRSGERAMTELLVLTERPTAVFVASDTVALGVLQVLRRYSLSIPQDIALVGFDDIPLAAYIDPPLTTVRLPAFDLGRAAATMLIRLIEGDTDPENNIVLETELLVRESCGAGLSQRT